MPQQVDANINAVLAQMRQMRLDAQGLPELDRKPAQSAGEFNDVFSRAIANVNDAQTKAGSMANDYVTGESQDLVGTMIASQKANVGFQGLLAVRNRMVSAYQDIMNMPI